ncbi:ABC transporter substrate-binding protein [Corynebacterium tapiri]|uniref:ABC transporter substrate-binding protein n=1 Tax=Corynebacterium tapiri TaxID=1448266 RepID=A0A5C4U4C6_9CORY|nr:ABC transporter substrate-binding protein [Corynebacterium tapiri]TNL96830.1 ABC transporter substrate-binding protein [Corynebacterium tapiri]
MTRSFTRRDILRSGLVLAGALGTAGLAGCSSKPSQGEAITIGFVPIACAAPLVLAHANGLFEKHGVKVQLKKFAGWADLWTAYATGDLTVAHMLSPMPIAVDAALTNASRPTEIAFTQNTNGQALTLGAQHHPHVQSVQDLRGMVLGIPFEYSVHALLLRDYLASHGVDPVRDVELRLLRPPDMVAQLEVGTIDGFIGPEPFLQRTLTTGAGRIFELTKNMWAGHPCCSVAMAKDFRTEHPQQARGLTAALTEAAAVLNDPAHASESAAQLGKEKYLNQKPKLIEPALTGKYVNWADEPVVDPDYLRFGDPTSATAITWMAAQLHRFELDGGQLNSDHAIGAAARSVLPADADTSLSPATINGQVFDPARYLAS